MSKVRRARISREANAVGGGAGDTHEYLLLMKGAPEILIKRCSRILNADGEETALDEAALRRFRHAYDAFGEVGSPLDTKSNSHSILL